MFSKAWLLVVVGILYAKVNSAEDQHFPGFSGSDSSYVVGGEDVNLGELPYQISLRRGSEHVCGGSVVNKDWVLTAAHCVPRDGNPRGVYIWAGTISSVNRSQACELPVKTIVIHPEYKYIPRPFFIINDVALLQLTSSLEFGPNIQPVILPNYPSERQIDNTVISGWGESKNPRTRGILQKATLNLVSDEQCRAVYRDMNITVPDSQICGGDKGGNKAQCYGDSGGPWVVPGSRIQIGVVSWVWGFNCTSPKYPSVAMEVPYFTSWIRRWIQTPVQSG